MQSHSKRPKPLEFPCISCGLCCQSLDKAQAVYGHLDRGDGTCIHLSSTHDCSIYENRPVECNIRDYHAEQFSASIEWPDFIVMNLKGCLKLMREQGRTDLVEQLANQSRLLGIEITK
mgnify:CR=1 FL=1